MKLCNEDKIKLIETYVDRFKQYGYSPKSLLWDKSRQSIRFQILTSLYNFEAKSILDIGCGFGDLNKILQQNYNSYKYLGIDLVSEFVAVGTEKYGNDNIFFEEGDFLSKKFNNQFDFIIASGIFNLKLNNTDNYRYIEDTIEKAMNLTKDGVAFDFLSDKVDYQYDYTFHSNPEKILSIAYKYSRNIVIRNDYMPFEYSLFIFKDDSFEKKDAIFNRYKLTNSYKKKESL